MSGRRIRGLRWWIIGLVMAGTAINFLTRSTLGVAAPILLTLLRMIQGLSVGGEYTTSIVFMVVSVMRP